MQLDALVIRIERGLMRRLPSGFVVAANARLHRWKGELELRELDRLVRPGTLAVDVGAHFGTYSHALCRIVGRQGKVIAVEPIAEDANLLRAAARQLRLPLEVRDVAISSTSGTAELHVPARHGKHKTALSSLEAHEGRADTRTVTTMTLDELLAEETLPVSFIKIDVEGHEAAVLAGAGVTLARHRPNLLIEIEGRFRPSGVGDVVRTLDDLDYDCEFIDGSGARRPFAEFDPAVHQDPTLDPLDRRYVGNFIFTPRPAPSGGSPS
jgi:FkbM family methyltransferase